MRLCIKTCVPRLEEAAEWGDWHMAQALKRALEKLGHGAMVQIMPEWYDKRDGDCDAVIQLRGLDRYRTSSRHVNVMWNISHPEKVGTREYEGYDLVFIASDLHAEVVRKRVATEVAPLLQCTDPGVFYPSFRPEHQTELLFVGNSRKVFRRIIKDLLPTDLRLDIWGTRWEPFVDKKYIRGAHYPNESLRELYSSCGILLNDHWDDMRENGFISNRIFDALACSAFVISDGVAGLESVLPGAVVTYDSPGDLKDKISYYLKNEDEKKAFASKGHDLVLKYHTFDERVRTIVAGVERAMGSKDKRKDKTFFKRLLPRR